MTHVVISLRGQDIQRQALRHDITDSNTARTLANHDRIEQGGYAPTMQYIPQSDARLLNKMFFGMSSVEKKEN
jgi:hypothetical protein